MPRGNFDHFKKWAKEVDSAGVRRKRGVRSGLSRIQSAPVLLPGLPDHLDHLVIPETRFQWLQLRMGRALK